MAAGIGFTVAIFISKLAFHDVSQQEQAILAVLCASAISGILSLTLFKLNFSGAKPGARSKAVNSN